MLWMIFMQLCMVGSCEESSIKRLCDSLYPSTDPLPLLSWDLPWIPTGPGTLRAPMYAIWVFIGFFLDFSSVWAVLNMFENFFFVNKAQ